MNKLKITIAKLKFFYHKRLRIHLIYFLLFSALAINAYSYMLWKNEVHLQSSLLGEAYIIREVVATPASASADEVTMREWIKNEVKKEGLDWKKIDCLIRNESGWNEYAQGVNTNKTTDSGIFQINSIHKDTISLIDRFDYKKSTRWAINKIKHDGNLNSWHGAKNCQ